MLARPDTVCGRNVAAASAAVSPRSPSTSTWWKVNAVPTSERTPTPPHSTQNIGTRTTCRAAPDRPAGRRLDVGTASGSGARERRGTPTSAIGTISTHTTTPWTSHAVRKPCSAIRASSAIGASEIPADPMAVTMPIAVPNRRCTW
ncbi:hypothetical protein BJF90_40925 [Pseudonocardia sp. CNS-004]|nr:hypothetical protein BJF90_40925 [Pseudonocardia sp. CNS-004]